MASINSVLCFFNLSYFYRIISQVMNFIGPFSENFKNHNTNEKFCLNIFWIFVDIFLIIASVSFFLSTYTLFLLSTISWFFSFNLFIKNKRYKTGLTAVLQSRHWDPHFAFSAVQCQLECIVSFQCISNLLLPFHPYITPAILGNQLLLCNGSLIYFLPCSPTGFSVISHDNRYI